MRNGDGSLGFGVEIAEILFDAAAFFAVTDLADLFGGEFFFVAALFAAGHDGAEGFDFGDDGGEVELFDLGADFVGVFVGDGGFAEVWFAVEPTDVDVAGVVFDKVAAMIGSAMLPHEGGAGEVAAGAVGGEGVEFFVVVSEDEKDGLGHVEGDEPEEGAALLVFPGGGGSFSMEVGVAAFPDEVVLVAEAFDRVRADAIEETGVDGFVVGAGPAGDVLEGFPVGLAIG